MPETGRYLSSFTDAFLRSRGIEEQRASREAQEAGEIFKLTRYLDDVGREDQASQTLATMLKNQRARVVAGPAVPPSATYEGALNPEAPSLPVEPQAQAAMLAPTPPRPVMQTIFEGVTPEQQAGFLRSQTGRVTLGPIEQAERERRKQEEQAEAKTFFDRAMEVSKTDPAGGADLMAAMYRRLGRLDDAGRMMEVSAKARTDKREREQAPKDLAAIYAASRSWRLEPTPVNLAKVHEAISGATSVTGNTLGLEIMKKAIGKTLSADQDENAFMVEATLGTVRDKLSPKAAWERAAKKYPGGLAKLWNKALFSPDKQMPDWFWDVLRVEAPPPAKDMGLRQQAWRNAYVIARQRGIPGNSLEFSRLWTQEILTLEKAEAEAKQSPEQRESAKLRNEYLRLRIEAEKNPQAFDEQKLTVMIDRLNRDITIAEESDDVEDVQTFTELKKFFSRQLVERAKAKGHTPGPAPPPGALPVLPPASEHRGERFRGSSGRLYQSDGIRWTKVP